MISKLENNLKVGIARRIKIFYSRENNSSFSFVNFTIIFAIFVYNPSKLDLDIQESSLILFKIKKNKE